MAIATVNPTTGQLIKTFQPFAEIDIEKKLQRAESCFREYKRSTFQEKGQKLKKVAEILETEKDRFAKTITLEMGKTFKSALEEVTKCAWNCHYYAEHAERFLIDEPVSTSATRSYIRYQPLGPILAVMPWNFPFWQVFRFAAPALMAGNVALLKHASNVPQCALLIEEIFRKAGFPEGVFQTLLISSQQVKQVIEDKRIAAITLTGSVAAGSQVASTAARFIKKSVLELGGSDPFIVMPSARLDEAVQTAVLGRTLNAGQSCVATKRFILAEAIASDFEKKFLEKLRGLKIGDPMDPLTELGPLATKEGLDALDQQVKASVSAGARILLGGHRLDGPGYYYAPTVLTDIPKESPAYREEIFGPVALLFRVKNITEAIQVANDTEFGLGANAWTSDPQEQDQFADELEAGSVFINSRVASDPHLPFGGIKQSGYGRELGVYGLREFVNIKSVWMVQV